MWMHYGQPYLVMHELGATVKFAVVSALMGHVCITYLQMMLRPPSRRASCRS